jgi:hypothetical protein
MTDTPRRPGKPPKPAEWRRWLGIVLRSAHLAGVVWMGAAYVGTAAPAVGAGGMAAGHTGALLVLVSGVALLLSEWFDGRIRLGELAGAVVLAKLAAVAWMALGGAGAQPLFWAVLVLSAISSHAPRELRHWPVLPRRAPER